MAGTKIGGRKAAQTNKSRYGEDFYMSIGTIGGRNGHTGGFGSNKVGADGLTGRERARLAGSKGGRISKRKKSKVEQFGLYYQDTHEQPEQVVKTRR
jgi:hypothetical protein